jgi:hypothetical protein
MKRTIPTILAASILAISLAFGAFGAAAAQEDSDCVSSRQAQQAVENGQVLQLPEAARRAGIEQKFIGDEARLCDVNGGPHWIVSVMKDNGDSERIVLNAQGN